MNVAIFTYKEHGDCMSPVIVLFRKESRLKLNKLYGAEHYSRGHQLCSHSIVSQHFMEPEGSYRIHELSTCSYPEPE
jgi:hypothetical protein